MAGAVTIYTDGSSLGNPGPGGYGAILLYTDRAGELHRKELTAGYERTTNNRMELMAAIAALEALKRPCEVELHADSEYLLKPFTEGWISGWVRRGWKKADKQPVKNRDLWERLLAAAEPHSISWFWVKGHDGTELNEECDQMARDSAGGKSGELAVDAGFKESDVDG